MNTSSKWLKAGAGSIAVAAGLVVLNRMRARKVEEPPFTREASDGPFEIRRYEPRVVAETRVGGTWREAGNRGFRRLADYIFGGNAGSAQIAMTAPVGERPGRELPMTAPVGERPSGDGWLVSFTMPAGETLESLPAPLAADVELRAVPPTRVGVVRFSGRWTETRMKKREGALRAWLSTRGLQSSGDAEVNRYDPPWTPWFMRRNEVWLTLQEG